MHRGSVSPQGKVKSRSLQKIPSPALVDYLQKQYPKRLPISALTAASKVYGRGRVISKNDPTIVRLASGASDLPTNTLIGLLSSGE